MKRFSYGLIGLIGLGLSGCKPEPDRKIITSLETVKNEKAAYVPSFPPFPSTINFKYTATNFRDPFEPYFAPSAPDISNNRNLKNPNLNRVREALESYPLDSLSMVGVLQRQGVLMALIQDKSNIIHSVKVGNYIGQNSGKIEKISDKSLEITEWLTDGKGEWREHTVVLPLVKAKE